MLYLSLILSAIVLGCAFFAARKPPHPIRWQAFSVGTGVALALACPFALLPTFYFWVALLLALGAWSGLRHRVRHFYPFAACAVLVACGIVGWSGYKHNRQYAQMRERFPYESMADRVPIAKPPTDQVLLSVDADRRLAKMENEVEFRVLVDRRAQALHRLHEDTTRLFVDSPGFGQFRMHSLNPTEESLRPYDKRPPDPPDQPGSPFRPTGSDPDAPKEIPTPTLYDLHARGVLDFVNPAGFGFIKDRRNVAGFLPHAFSETPAAPDRWAVERVELIGLLLNPEPVVYVSEQLPAMDLLRGAPTRRLDEVETAGLAALRKGEDLHTTWSDGRLRVVGSLRNGNQCLGCHGGQRGDLLGAFSYSLRIADER
jgi:hypothetical protein